MSPFARLAILLAVDVEPVACVGVEGSLQGLVASAWKGHQILKQGIDADDSFDRVSFWFAGESWGGDLQRTVDTSDPRGLGDMREFVRRIERSAVELEVDETLGKTVMRLGPGGECLPVALGTALRSCVGCEDFGLGLQLEGRGGGRGPIRGEEVRFCESSSHKGDQTESNQDHEESRPATLWTGLGVCPMPFFGVRHDRIYAEGSPGVMPFFELRLLKGGSWTPTRVYVDGPSGELHL
jgi:hypothetical protein